MKAIARVEYAEHIPTEFRRRLGEAPIAYLPLGPSNGTENTCLWGLTGCRKGVSSSISYEKWGALVLSKYGFR